MRRGTLAFFFLFSLSAAAADVTPIRNAVKALDFEAAVRAADELIAAHPEALDARGWRVYALVWFGSRDAAATEADWLVREHPDDPWSWFARCAVREDLASSDEMMKRVTTPNRDIAWMRARVLRRAKATKDAVAAVDELLAAFPNDSRLMAVKATIVGNDPARYDEAIALYEQAHAADPADASILLQQSQDLGRRKRTAEAEAKALEALRLSPDSLTVQRNYWQAVRARRDLSEDARRAALDPQIEGLLRARGDRPDVLRAIAFELGEEGRRDEQQALEATILHNYPLSSAAEASVYGRMEEFQRRNPKLHDDPALARQYLQVIRDFIAWSCHEREYLAFGYLALYLEIRNDPQTSEAELLEAIRGMRSEENANPHIVYLDAAVTLADRGIELDEAERLAKKGAAIMAARRPPPMIDKAEAKRMASYAAAQSHDAIGWVALARKQNAEARRELQLACDLFPEFARSWYHLGRLEEAEGHAAAAQRAFLSGMLVRGFGANPNEAALKAIYAKQHGGSMAGFDEFVRTARGGDTDQRKTAVLRDRIGKPEPAPRFALKTLSGGTLSLDDLRGKIAVVNFWGVWCSWCVAELPEFQALVKKYAGDDNVRILTINNDADAEKVRRWMSEKKFDFSVLLDDGYVASNRIFAFPTTWFLDPSGRIAFQKRGASEKLVEEFSWRIDALRAAKH
jgi:peroxiredoxin/tetratricopeptide (TPR) repeat protein